MKTRIVVASKNPVKINAVKIGFDRLFPDMIVEVHGVSVESGVSDQPMTDEETLSGANNRALNASHLMSDADYWVGLEGGIQPEKDTMSAFAWIVVKGKTGVGKARTGAFFLPPQVVRLIEAGKELGEADDIVFAHQNSKQQGGAVGLLTDNVIDRTSLYVDAVIMALIPFKNQKLYKDDA